MKAVALVCPSCGGRLLADPGTPFGVCNPCSKGWDFSSGRMREVPVEEPAAAPAGGAGDTVRLPFYRFEAAGRGGSAPVFVMAFAIGRIGSPHDDGSMLTMEGFEGEVRPGTLDRPPGLGLPTAAGLARFLALRKLDMDGALGLKPNEVRLGDPSILAVPFDRVGDRLTDRVTGLTLDARQLGS